MACRDHCILRESVHTRARPCVLTNERVRADAHMPGFCCRCLHSALSSPYTSASSSCIAGAAHMMHQTRRCEFGASACAPGPHMRTCVYMRFFLRSDVGSRQGRRRELVLILLVSPPKPSPIILGGQAQEFMGLCNIAILVRPIGNMLINAHTFMQRYNAGLSSAGTAAASAGTALTP